MGFLKAGNPQLKLGQDVLVYNPQRVLGQSGYDQRTFRTSGDVFTENKILAEGILEILVGVERIFFLGVVLEGATSPIWVLFWEKCLEVLDGFMFDKEET